MKWKRSSGSIIETNNRKETVDHCESIGWEPVVEPKPVIVSKEEPRKGGKR